MPRTKSKPDQRARNGTAASATSRAATESGDVLTLAEAAAYLRVGEPDVLRLVREQGLPGRQVGDDWRFLKTAIAGWLGTPAPSTASEFWRAHAAAFQDDPHLDEM